MKSIKLTYKEISELRYYYIRERDTMIERLHVIDGILEKIDADYQASGEIPPLRELSLEIKRKGSGKNGEQSAAISGLSKPVKSGLKSKTRKKRKPNKSKWGSFVLDLLKQQGKPIRYEHLIEEAIYRFEVPEDKRANVKQSIANTSFNLRNRLKKIRAFRIEGMKGKFIGLNRWFDKEGVLKEKYREQIPVPATPKKPRKKKETQAEATTEPSVPGRPTWPEFVMNSLSEEGMPIPARALTEKAMKQFEIADRFYEKTRIAIARTMSNLDRERNTLRTYSQPGVAGKFYGLAQWFDDKGQLKKDYLGKLLKPEKADAEL